MDWHEWRRAGLGASDAPVVMGVSPYRTRYDLWLEKTGQEKKDMGNWATRRGNDLEPRARAMYELENGIAMPPKLVEHKTHPFIRASLDGFNEEAGVVLEIKCPGAEDHSTALAGKIPEKYYPQVQQQLLVTGAKAAHYYSFDGEKGALVHVMPDMEYCQKLFIELCDFWDLVVTRQPPALTNKDYKKVKDPELKNLLALWRSAKREADLAGEKLKAIRNDILNHPAIKEHARLSAQGVRVYTTTRKGLVDYAKIPELKNVDLEIYRKKSSEVVTIELDEAGNSEGN